MEFEELRKVWDKQNDKPMYVIDEKALEGIVSRKKRSAIKKAQIMEVILIGANLIAGSVVLVSHTMKGSGNVYAFIMGGVMVFTALLILYFRNQRIAERPIYENTMAGDLEHGLSDARYVVRMSRTMQYYFLMIGVLMIFSLGFDSWMYTLGMAGFIAFTLYASTWEHKWYVKKLRDLVQLKRTIEENE
jgi:hypothetical protein